MSNSRCGVPAKRTCGTPGCGASACSFTFGRDCADVRAALCGKCAQRRDQERERAFRSGLEQRAGGGCSIPRDRPTRPADLVRRDAPIDAPPYVDESSKPLWEREPQPTTSFQRSQRT